MVGIILPDCGGSWVPNTGGGGSLSPDIVKQLSENGQKGVVLSGVVAWIEVQLDQHGSEIWRPLAEKNWLEGEISAAKEALRAVCGQELLTLYPEFKTNRQGPNKKSKEIEDIIKAIQALQSNNSMPLIIASSGMMGRCPSSWGQPANPSSQDLMEKVHMLEEVMSTFMEQQRKQMDKLTGELATARVTAPRTPGLHVPPIIAVDSPAKKRKFEAAQSDGASYAGAVLGGVKPLGQQQQNSIRVIQSLLQQQNSPRQNKNICFGTAKTSGNEGNEKLLAADVDLVATGVGKDCTNDDLKDFLQGKGIDAVAVETLTRDEVLPNVRTKTFRITVKAAQYEKSLNPDVWPYRVAVRHYRAPKRPESTWGNQSGRTGGLVDRGDKAVQQARVPDPGQHVGGAGGRVLGDTAGTQKQPQKVIHRLPDPVQISNLYGILSQLGGLEVPPH